MGAVYCLETTGLEASNEDVPRDSLLDGQEGNTLMVGIAGARGLRDAAWLLSAAGERSRSGRLSGRLSGRQHSKDGCRCTVEVLMKGRSVRYRTSTAGDALAPDPIWRAEIPIGKYVRGAPLRFTVTDEGGTGDVLGSALVAASEFEQGLNAELPLTGGESPGAFLKVKIKSKGREYPPGPPPSFEIEVAKAADQPAGLELDVQDGTMAYVLAVNPGPISVHNETAPPGLCLLPGYFIEKVNDTKGDSSELVDTMQAASKLTLLVRRPEDFSVLVRRRRHDDSLGLVFQQRPNGRTLAVDAVEAGPVQAWNDDYKDFQVRRGDRVVSVGGEPGEAGELLERMGASRRAVLGIARPAASGPEGSWRFW